VYGANGPGEVLVGNLTGTWSNNDPVFTGDGVTQLTTATGAAITNAGHAFQLLPVPANTRSSLHFVVGGSGGGGAGSEPSFTLHVSTSPNAPAPAWAAGAGGSGGGGAIALRAGDTFRIVNGGQVLARGGNVQPLLPGSVADSQAAPGGGGSGGSVLMQAGRIADLGSASGAVDVQGGVGGSLSKSSNGSPAFTINSEGGHGSPGFARLEAPGNLPPAALPVLPGPATSDNVTSLQEVDTRTGFRSTFYSTGQPFGPEFVRYEVHALVDGVPVVFSDDPSIGVPARFGQAPIEISLQAGSVDLATGQVDPVTIQPWRAAVVGGVVPGLADDALNGFRYQIVLDRTGGQQVQIDRVIVVFRV
jgi:hypothetical protein